MQEEWEERENRGGTWRRAYWLNPQFGKGRRFPCVSHEEQNWGGEGGLGELGGKNAVEESQKREQQQRMTQPNPSQDKYLFLSDSQMQQSSSFSLSAPVGPEQHHNYALSG